MYKYILILTCTNNFIFTFINFPKGLEITFKLWWIRSYRMHQGEIRNLVVKSTPLASSLTKTDTTCTIIGSANNHHRQWRWFCREIGPACCLGLPPSPADVSVSRHLCLSINLSLGLNLNCFDVLLFLFLSFWRVQVDVFKNQNSDRLLFSNFDLGQSFSIFQLSPYNFHP